MVLLELVNTLTLSPSHHNGQSTPELPTVASANALRDSHTP